MLTKRVQSWLGGNVSCRLGVCLAVAWIGMWGGGRMAIADDKAIIAEIEFYGCRVRIDKDDGTRGFVGFSTDLTDSRAVANIAELENVKSVLLTHCRFDPRELASVAGHRKTMEVLSLYDTPTNDEAMPFIGALTELKMLNLGQTKVTGEGFAQLAELKKLELLWLDNLAIGDDSIEHLAKLKGLKELRVHGPHTFTADGETRLRKALPDCAVSLGNYVETETRAVQSKYGFPAYFAVMEIQRLNGHFIRRREVDRIGVYEQDLTKSSLMTDFSNLPPLQGITISKCRFDPRDLKHLLVSEFRLQELYLYDTPTDDQALQDIGKLTNLTMLGLSRTKVTSAGMPHLTGLTNLKYLSLGGTVVGDDAIEHLAKLKSLKKLAIVGDTKFTDDGQKKLKQALPNCAVEFRPSPR